MKRWTALIFLCSSSALAKPACYLLTGSEIPRVFDRVILKADTETVKGEFEFTAFDKSGKGIASSTYQCTTSTSSQSECMADDDMGSFKVVWKKDEMTLTSRLFNLGDDEDQPMPVKAPLKPGATKDRPLEEFQLKGHATDCPSPSKKDEKPGV